MSHCVHIHSETLQTSFATVKNTFIKIHRSEFLIPTFLESQILNWKSTNRIHLQAMGRSDFRRDEVRNLIFLDFDCHILMKLLENHYNHQSQLPKLSSQNPTSHIFVIRCFCPVRISHFGRKNHRSVPGSIGFWAGTDQNRKPDNVSDHHLSHA